MNRAILAALTAVLSLASARLAGAETFDVVVYGGTPGGIAAAVAAKRDGASVVLLEQKRHVGGLSTSGLTNAETSHLDEKTLGGICREFFTRLGRQYGKDGPVWRWESHEAQEVFDAMLEEAKVPVRYGQLVEKVEKDGPRITRIGRIVMTDGTSVSGRVFVDGSYEGDLMARAGVRYIVGRESRQQYGEPLAGVQLIDRPIDVSPYDEAGKLLEGFSPPEGITPGAADKKFMNYNFRLCYTRDPDNKVPVTRPENYDPARYAMLVRYLEKHPKTRLAHLIDLYKMPGGKFEMNNKQNAIISVGHFGANFDYPEADHRRRQAIWQDHKDYTQGFLYFLGNDPRVPEALRHQTLQWGLAKDEFTDNGNWPYYLYIREARRMIGAYVMTQHDVRQTRTKPDSIGVGSHYIDSHHVQRVAISRTQFVNEGRIWVPGKHYHLPYRSITPKKAECENLLVPVCVSSSHVAFCTVRLEPTWMVLGQSAGTAAAMAARGGKAVQDVDVKELQERLRAAGQILDCPEVHR